MPKERETGWEMPSELQVAMRQAQDWQFIERLHMLRDLLGGDLLADVLKARLWQLTPEKDRKYYMQPSNDCWTVYRAYQLRYGALLPLPKHWKVER